MRLNFALFPDRTLTDLTIFSDSSVRRKKYLYIKERIRISIFGRCHPDKVLRISLNFVTEIRITTDIILRIDLIVKIIETIIPSFVKKKFNIITGSRNGNIIKTLLIININGIFETAKIIIRNRKIGGMERISILYGKTDRSVIRKIVEAIFIPGGIE